jgi:hypothetical protein
VSTKFRVRPSCSAGGDPSGAVNDFAPNAKSSTYASHDAGGTASAVVSDGGASPSSPSPQALVLNATTAGSPGLPVPRTTNTVCGGMLKVELRKDTEHHAAGALLLGGGRSAVLERKASFAPYALASQPGARGVGAVTIGFPSNSGEISVSSVSHACKSRKKSSHVFVKSVSADRPPGGCFQTLYVENRGSCRRSNQSTAVSGA